jgi:hypothetical protein
MQLTRFAAAFASAVILVAAAGSGVGAQTTPAPAGAILQPVTAGGLALDARSLRARRTPSGYTLTGQALVNDACQAARFDRVLGNIFPPLYNLDQFRRPGTMGLLCVMRLTWVTVPPKVVTSAAAPRFVTVHTRKGSVRVPVL